MPHTAVLSNKPFPWMDHPCHKCSQAVEDGTAFCRQCGAPQIRVVLPEAAQPAGGASEGGAISLPFELSSRNSLPSLPRTSSGALVPCVLAALCGGVCAVLQLNPYVVMLGVGFLAVVFFRRRHPGLGIKTLAGIRLGAIGGMLFFAGIGTLGMITIVALVYDPQLRAPMIEKLETSIPGKTADLQPFIEYIRNPIGVPAFVVLEMVLLLIAAIILGGLGGLIASSIFRRRDPN